MLPSEMTRIAKGIAVPRVAITPLTRLKLQLEMLADDKTNTELLSDVNEMQKMLENYLN